MIYNGYPLDYIIKAGYFDSHADKEANDSSFSFLAQDDPIPQRFRDGRSIILGISGCMAPMHRGHLEILKKAKEYFLKNGYEHVQAVIYPAHDSYVSTKTEDYPIQKRLQSILEIIKNEDWIYIDSFPATHLTGEINFPYLVDNLQKLGAWCCAETAFVFGEDNAHFTLAFMDSPTIAVCIARNGGYDSSLTNYRIKSVFIDQNDFKTASSTAIRNSISAPR